MWIDPRVPSIAVRVSSFGDLLGTGFIVGVPSESVPGRNWPYVVTAHHVIRGQVGIAVEVPDPLNDHKLSAPVEISDWRQPLENVDLALAPLWPVGNCLILNLEEVLLEPGRVPPLGSPVLYVGILNALEVPMVRGGTLGALEVPIKKENPNGTHYDYPAHLIDCRSYAGFSGSPCFSQVMYAVANETPQLFAPPGPLPGGEARKPIPVYCQNVLAGMFTAHVSDEEPPHGAASRYGVGVMLRSDEIWEALMTDDAKAERRKWDKQHKQRGEADAPKLQDASASPARSRAEVLSDFEKAAGPLRGHNRDQKPKA